MRLKLYTFPFAGGSRYCYKDWLRFSSLIECIPVEYSGRGSRIREPLFRDLDSIVEDILPQVINDLKTPYGFYGHSMGAIVAYLAAHKLKCLGSPLPAQLFLSGRGAPSTRPGTTTYRLSSPEFRQALRDLGGVAEEALGNDVLMEFFEPILRSDFEAIESYEHSALPLLNIPITVMIGSREKVSMREALAWQEETTGPVEVRQFEGSHFFIFDFAKDIVSQIESTLSSLTRFSPTPT